MAMTTEAPESTSLLTVSVDEKSLGLISQIAEECAVLNVSDVAPLIRTMKMARAMDLLRKLFTDDLMKEIMKLQGSRLGFRTDKDSGQGYPVNVVRECCVEATMRGAHLVDNEFNIIAGNCYLTKEYFQRVQAEFPGLELAIQPQVPEIRGDTARVGYVATWKLRGREDELRCVVTKDADGLEHDYRIPIRVNNGMGVDAILGKAERKMRARIMQRITGSASGYPDGDADDAIEATVKPPTQTLDDLTKKLTENGNGTKADSPPADDNVIRTFEARITECETAMELQQVAGDLKAVSMSNGQRDSLRSLWAKRQKELK